MDPKRLREETRREHEATEALLPLGHAGLTREEYATGLRTLWPVVASWEGWSAEHAPEELRDLVRGRQRAKLLEADLRWLNVSGVASGAAPALDWMAVVSGGEGLPWQADGEAVARFRAGFLGSLYVMEGSTLGGRFLARHVVAELGEAYAPATQYFQGHGEQTGAMWREVTARISAIPEALAEVTIGAAKRSFAVFGEALQAGMALSGHSDTLTRNISGAS